MSGKSGLIIGLLIGLVLAISASITTVMLVSGEIEEKQAAAYDRGFDDAMENLKGDREKLSTAFNQGMMEQNQSLHDDVSRTRNRLQALMARDDVPQSVKDELADVVNELPAEE